MIKKALRIGSIICFIVMLPVNYPAWLALDIVYGIVFGSGIRPIKNPVRAEYIARVISWLTCSAVAGVYVLPLLYIKVDYRPVLTPTQALFVIHLLGFIALQALLLLESQLPFQKEHCFQATDDVSYKVKCISPGEDFRIYNVTRHVSGRPPVTASFMCPCETPYQDLTIVHGDTHSVRVEGIFSTKVFSFPAVSPYHEEDREEGRGILQINYSDCSAPELKMLRWLPLRPEQDREVPAMPAMS